MKHPLPWRLDKHAVSDAWFISDAGGQVVLDFLDHDEARQFVEAVNAHADLVAACKAGILKIQRLCQELGRPTDIEAQQLIDAIAKAKSQEIDP